MKGHAMKNLYVLLLAVFLSVSPVALAHGQMMDDGADEMAALISAAEAGNAEAQALLGGFYAEGIGVSQDDEKAFYWFEQSAGQDSALGQLGMGSLYHEGIGVAKDMIRARAWYALAAMKDPETAEFFIEEADKEMSPDEIQKAQELSQKLLDEINK